ncbi:MAG: glycoside hydrolase family 28 protein [Chlorobi bacterium]|nr:glycoside hydrolase family 28 protein [Chlorobiota bacterium]
MKPKLNLSWLIIFIIFYSCSGDPGKVRLNEIAVDAPFKMPTIKIPDFSNSKQLLITDFGAVQGDKDKTTQAIKDAIDEANKIGGGTVVIPEGEWLTGKVHFKSNVNLHLNEGAVLLFSEDPADYLPPVQSSWEGMECYNYSPLIYAFECENIAITGKGTLKAKMDIWKKWFARPKPHMAALVRLYNMAAKDVPVEKRQMVADSAHLRPQFIQFNRCKNILLDGVSIRNSPFWTIHLFMSENAVIRNVDVKALGHNNDGVDPEMSRNVLIENSSFDQGDDAISVKSGRNRDAWRLNTPSKNIVVRNCTVKRGHQLMAIGSELSGGVENVLVENCTVNTRPVKHLLYIKTNERRGGFVKNIFMKNVQAERCRNGILGIETDVLYQWRDIVPTYERRLTPIEDIYLENVHASAVKYISRIMGNAELPVENVVLKNITADKITGEKYINENVEGFKVIKE